MALLPRHFTSGYQQTFPQVASLRLYYARHTRGTRQPLSGRELPIFLAITRACKPELAEYVRRFLTPTSPFYAVVPEGRMLTSPLLRKKFFHPRPLCCPSIPFALLFIHSHRLSLLQVALKQFNEGAARKFCPDAYQTARARKSEGEYEERWGRKSQTLITHFRRHVKFFSR